MGNVIRLAGSISMTVDQAQLAVVGYAFAVRPRAAKGHPAAFESETAPTWAYRTYDCIPASVGDCFDYLDVLVVAGLNARLDATSVAALTRATGRAAGHLAIANAIQPAFADLSQQELSGEPPAGSAGWALTEAWRQMVATHSVGRARAHKALHHKRPALFPLLDSRTGPVLSSATSGRNAWQQINADLNDNRSAFESLKLWFADIARPRDGHPLELPRLHDILLWLHQTGNLKLAVTKGEDLLVE